jgi:ABC-2 type transport system permease protein
MTRLIRSEYLKIRTTHIWWILALSAFAFVALAFLLQALQIDSELHQPRVVDLPPGVPPEQAEQMRQQQAEQAARAHTPAALAAGAANLYTSGQYFGLLVIMLLGILSITNEYRHQTVTATFLVTPKRTRVVVAKLIVSMAAAAVLWLVTTAVNVVAGVIFYSAEHVPNSLGRTEVNQAIALNLLAYALWAVMGIGLGALIRSQIGATITATALYLIGTQAAAAVIYGLWTLIKKNWVVQGLLFVPSYASQYMVGGLQNVVNDVRLWPRWAAALILVGYGLVAGAVGTLILRKRDVS